MQLEPFPSTTGRALHFRHPHRLPGQLGVVGEGASCARQLPHRRW